MIKNYKTTAKYKTIGQVTKEQLKSIAEIKWEDLNAASIDTAINMIEGTAKSMGLIVKG